jgi:signal peptide peptidase SppA
MRYAHVARWFIGSAWAILPEKLAVMVDTLGFLMAGGQFSEEEIAQRVGASPGRPRRVVGDIAVLPILGTISHRGGMLGESSGGTSVEGFTMRLRQALSDPAIGAIVLDIDSPGGNVDGVAELADEIYAARDAKPIVAVANALAASAAYWLGTSAGEFSVTPSGEVGSIGVWAAHMDASAAYEREGIRATIVRAGKFKAELNPFEPLTEEARAALQERVDDSYDMFVRAVARNRAVSVSDVRGGFGEGRVVTARQAKAMGMVDRIETLDQAIERLRGRGGKGTRGASVALERRRFEMATM